jgi:hypothetical protein
MSELRATRTSLSDPSTVAGVATGVCVSGVLMACLMRPEIGRYLTEAIALTCALAAGGIALFLVRIPEQLPPTAALRTLTVRLAVAAFAAAMGCAGWATGSLDPLPFEAATISRSSLVPQASFFLLALFASTGSRGPPFC